MFRHMGLDEEGRARRVDPRRQEPDGHVEGAALQGGGVVLAGDGVEIHDGKEALVPVLQRYPVLDGTEPVADVQVAGGLDTGKDAGHFGKLPTRARGRKWMEAMDLD